jgi:hypothetical protein
MNNENQSLKLWQFIAITLIVSIFFYQMMTARFSQINSQLNKIEIAVKSKCAPRSSGGSKKPLPPMPTFKVPKFDLNK